jgi:hypothetical protein
VSWWFIYANLPQNDAAASGGILMILYRLYEMNLQL